MELIKSIFAFIANEQHLLWLYGSSLSVFFIWLIFFRKRGRKISTEELLCRLLNRFKDLPPTFIVSRFAAKKNLSCTRFFVPTNESCKKRILCVWLGENEYSFIEDKGRWSIDFADS